MIRILTETDLRQAVKLDLEAVDCVAGGFKALAGGDVIMPPILSMAIEAHHGEVDVKTAYVPGLDSFAIKMSPGFFNNPKIGLPTTSGLMVLFSSTTGQVEAVLLDNGYLTDVRTAAAGAVAARHLARDDAASACVVGAGCQARLQLEALCLVRPIRRATVWARDVDKAELCAKDMADMLGIEVRVADSVQSGIKGADVVITTTPSRAPLVMADWLEPGQLITAMGSDQDGKSELEPQCLVRADRYVPDRQSQTAIMGELRPAIEAELVSAGTRFAELGDIVAGKAPGRMSPEQTIICDLTGTGVQDTAIATFARERSEVAGAGVSIHK